MGKVDILNLEWSSYGRDREMITPVIYFLESFYDLKISCRPVWDINAVDRLRPKMVLMSNTIGGKINHRALKYCYKRKIPVISLTSEGNFFEQDIDVQTWGWNKDKVKYESIWMLWSKDAAEMALKKYPDLKGKLYVSGGIGFDRYKIYEFMEKSHFLSKYKKEGFRKIIGYAGWLFGKIEKKRVRPWSLEQVKLAKTDKDKLNNILKNIIEKNKDILFIFKRHPAEADTWDSELYDLNKYSNTICLTNEENIADVINVCDIWLAYDSNTVIESWCLDKNKPTVFINPTITNFKRRKMYLGVPIARSVDSLQCMINEFYDSAKIQEFDNKKNIREKIICSLIQWDDGLNHIRASKTIYNAYRDISQSKYKFFLDREFIIHIKTYVSLMISSKFPKLPYIRNYNFINNRFSIMELSKLKMNYKKHLDKFYKINKHKIEIVQPSKKV